MEFTFAHNNINVLDLEKSVAFYKEALGLKEVRRKERDDFTLVFLEDGKSAHQLELTWLKDRTEPYELGDNESHLAFHVDNYDAAHAMHDKMGCICYENEAMGIYFIHDPDDYWTEIIPKKQMMKPATIDELIERYDMFLFDAYGVLVHTRGGSSRSS